MASASRSGRRGGGAAVHFAKTKLCKFEKKGQCSKGADCPYAHRAEEINPLPDLRRTKLCKTLVKNGICTDADCGYAHSDQELRDLADEEPAPREELLAKAMAQSALLHQEMALRLQYGSQLLADSLSVSEEPTLGVAPQTPSVVLCPPPGLEDVLAYRDARDVERAPREPSRNGLTRPGPAQHLHDMTVGTLGQVSTAQSRNYAPPRSPAYMAPPGFGTPPTWRRLVAGREEKEEEMLHMEDPAVALGAADTGGGASLGHQETLRRAPAGGVRVPALRRSYFQGVNTLVAAAVQGIHHSAPRIPNVDQTNNLLEIGRPASPIKIMRHVRTSETTLCTLSDLEWAS